jgi:hypothetical protein
VDDATCCGQASAELSVGRAQADAAALPVEPLEDEDEDDEAAGAAVAGFALVDESEDDEPEDDEPESLESFADDDGESPGLPAPAPAPARLSVR